EVEILSRLLRLRELVLLGNPISNENIYEERIKAMLPRLKVFDGTRFDEKQKRKERPNKFTDSDQSSALSEAQAFKKIRYDLVPVELQGKSMGQSIFPSEFQEPTIKGDLLGNSQTTSAHVAVPDFSQLSSDKFLDHEKSIII
ncbi:hypothetical protein L0F63_003746, partial [Massospora cicadina]